MSNIVIGIHGLGNKPKKELLENWWLQAMQEGLRGINKFIINPKFEMVYWADILYEKPLDENVLDKNDPYYIDEKYVPELIKHENNPGFIRKKFLDILEKGTDKLFLNDDLSLNYSFIFDSYIHKNFRDLEIYFSKEPLENNKQNKTAKELIRTRAVEIIKKYKNDNIFLIGHSMGSIIAYDILTFLIPEIKINTLVTIGSPLGQPFIISKIGSELKAKGVNVKKLKSPPGIVNGWYNFSDLEDTVAINYNLADDYDPNLKGIKPIDMQVHNSYEINGIKNPHKSYGYLRTPEFSNLLYEFLIHDKSSFRLWFNKSLNRTFLLLNKIFFEDT